MKRFVFSLASVLRFKRRCKWLAEARQQQAAMALQQARAEMEKMTEQVRQACARLQGRLGKPQDSATWLAVYRQFDVLEQALQSDRQKVERTGQEFEQAQTQRQRANLEVEALLILRQRKWQEHQRVQQRAEQQFLDELGLERWRIARASRRGQDTGEVVSP